MKFAAFNAVCNYKIGDRVVIAQPEGSIKTITDIACIHYVKSGKVEFLYELNDSGTYVRIKT